ncbi:MAG: hypothetical protein ACRERD_17420 [Candidatus Binatia bacterium]
MPSAFSIGTLSPAKTAALNRALASATFAVERAIVCTMPAITFDTLKFTKKLKEAGFPDAQAEAMVDAFLGASGEAELVTKKDLQIELAPVKADITLIKWMLGLLLVGVMALMLRAFFPA